MMNPPSGDGGSATIGGVSMPFQHCQSLNGVFVARQIGGVTWRFDRLGGHVINTPLPCAPALHRVSVLDFLNDYERCEAFSQLWDEAVIRPQRILDLTLWATMLLSIAKQLHVLQNECSIDGYDGTLNCMVKMGNLGLSAPFSDTRGFVDHIKGFGMPMTHDGDMSIPSGDDIAWLK